MANRPLVAAHIRSGARAGEAEILLDRLEIVGELPTKDERDLARELLQRALESWRIERPGLARKMKRDWCSKIGIYRHAERRESHYDCAFCRESLATIGHGTVGRLAPAFVTKLEIHTRRCSLLWIAASADQSRFGLLLKSGRGAPAYATMSEDFNANLEK